VPFLSAPPLAPEEIDRYFEPKVSSQTASLFEHCARALDRSLAVGPHGLPLMGTGDWNDGMNRVGIGGRGESVWLGWFLHTNLVEFAGDRRAPRGVAARPRLARTCHRSADGARSAGLGRRLVSPRLFRRRDPARLRVQRRVPIDSIAQSWGVISGAADPNAAAGPWRPWTST
jgi:cyclic beta-1,2-glucan synthetase